MTTLTVLRPDTRTAVAADVALAARPARRAGLRLTIIDNGKPKARPLMLAIADHLRHDLPDLRVAVVSKSSASWPVGTDEAKEIAAGTDLVLAGLGDCGGCSANSLADAVAMEALGVAATVVITEPFQGLVASYAARLGAPGYPCLVLPHPISSRTDDELAALADKATSSALNLLTQD